MFRASWTHHQHTSRWESYLALTQDVRNHKHKKQATYLDSNGAHADMLDLRKATMYFA
jgi:hypothetical protein